MELQAPASFLAVRMRYPFMELAHHIDAEIRAWLKGHVDNQSELSLAIGRSKTWLHKYVNGQGTATIDDLVRLGGLIMGLNLPRLTATEQRLLKVVQSLNQTDQDDVMVYAEHRATLARRERLKESSEPGAKTPPATGHTGLETRRGGAATTLESLNTSRRKTRKQKP